MSWPLAASSRLVPLIVAHLASDHLRSSNVAHNGIGFSRILVVQNFAESVSQCGTLSGPVSGC
jgi:hypothetical protein